MPIHIVSNDMKSHIPLFLDGYTIKEVCGLLSVKQTLVYKILNFYKRFSTAHLLRPGQLQGTLGVWSYLVEGHWLYRMWCALVNSLVLDLCSRRAEVVQRMQDLAQRLICEWTEDEVFKTFKQNGGSSLMILD